MLDLEKWACLFRQQQKTQRQNIHILSERPSKKDEGLGDILKIVNKDNSLKKKDNGFYISHVGW